MDQQLGKRIIALSQRVVANFDAGNWEEAGLLTGHSSTIDNYPRLLRSLNWGDQDYNGNVLGVLVVNVLSPITIFPFFRSAARSEIPAHMRNLPRQPGFDSSTFGA